MKLPKPKYKIDLYLRITIVWFLMVIWLPIRALCNSVEIRTYFKDEIKKLKRDFKAGIRLSKEAVNEKSDT